MDDRSSIPALRVVRLLVSNLAACGVAATMGFWIGMGSRPAPPAVPRPPARDAGAEHAPAVLYDDLDSVEARP